MYRKSALQENKAKELPEGEKRAARKILPVAQKRSAQIWLLYQYTSE